MCHVIEMHGGIADGFVAETCELPTCMAAWHDDADEAGTCQTILVDVESTDVTIPPGAVLYRRRWNHIHLLILPTETVVPMPYDLVYEHAEQHSRQQ